MAAIIAAAQHFVNADAILTARGEAAHQQLMSAAKQTPDSYGSERLIAFTDAVMAVAITLLVLDLKLPEGLTDGDLYVAIPALSHALWCYVLSFIVIGLLWMAHHNQFAHIRARRWRAAVAQPVLPHGRGADPVHHQRHERSPDRRCRP